MKTNSRSARGGRRGGRGWLGLAGAAAAVPLAGCSGVIDPQGPVASQQLTILGNSLAVMLAIVVPVIVATVAFAWWFRAGNQRATYRPTFVYSGRIELVVWSVPTMVVIFLGGIIWTGSHRLDPYRPLDVAGAPPPLTVEVVSLDWKWLFLYPEQGVASVNRLVVPAGRPLAFKLTSASVMTAFFVPQLGSMIYTMNGMETQVHLLADRPGTFAGLASHYSGDGFADMRFEVASVDAAGFDAFVQQARAGGGTLDRASYAALERQSTDVPPATYGTVDPALFGDLVRGAIPAAPGPSEQGPAETISSRS